MTNFGKIKKLTTKLSFKGGLNNTGQKMLRFRSGLSKKRFIITDNRRCWNKQFFLVCSFIKNFKKKYFALIKYTNGSYSYIHAIHGMQLGSFYKTYNNGISFINEVVPGISLYIQYARRFFIFSNICFNNKIKAIYATSPGTYCKISHKVDELGIVVFWLPTGTKKNLKYFTFVTLGRNMNLLKKYSRMSKAGDNLYRGFKPRVRGVAMNPVDHPNGGRTKTNQPEKSAWGWIAKKGK